DDRQLDDLWVLDTRRRQARWLCPQTSGSPPDGGRSGHSATAVGGRLVLIGGERELQREFFHDVFVLDTDLLTWSSAGVSGRAPVPRGWHSAAVLPEPGAGGGAGEGAAAEGARVLVFGGGRTPEVVARGPARPRVRQRQVQPVLQRRPRPRHRRWRPPLARAAHDLALDLGRLLLDRGDLADVRFAVEGGARELRAHSQVLCARSPVFSAMLSERGAWAEGASGALQLEGVSAEALERFLEYLYTGSCGLEGGLPADGAAGREGVDPGVRGALDLLELRGRPAAPRRRPGSPETGVGANGGQPERPILQDPARPGSH
ncbi:unnamed protein product, partial [Prorocentrum cordatum]